MFRDGQLRRVKDLENMSYEGTELREPGLFSLKKRRGWGDPIALYNYLKGGCSEVEARLFCHVSRGRIRENGLKLHQRRSRLDIKKKHFRHWVGSPGRWRNCCLGKYPKGIYLDMAFEDINYGGAMLAAGLDDLEDLFQS